MNDDTVEHAALMRYFKKALPATLTDRELECSHLLLLGYSAKEIARKMQISKRTTEFYLHKLKLKCHCSNRAQLTSFLRSKLQIRIKSILDLKILNEDIEKADAFIIFE